jgi:shikimate dehydrogenase
MTNKTPPDRYALVGHPVEHSVASDPHGSLGKPGSAYVRAHRRRAPRSRRPRGFGAAGGKGLNVTVPHRSGCAVQPVERSRDGGGAVNTISIADGP